MCLHIRKHMENVYLTQDNLGGGHSNHKIIIIFSKKYCLIFPLLKIPLMIYKNVFLKTLNY